MPPSREELELAICVGLSDRRYLDISTMALLLSIASAQAWTAGFSQPRAVAPRASAVSMAERTYIMIKPDGVQRGLVRRLPGLA